MVRYRKIVLFGTLFGILTLFLITQLWLIRRDEMRTLSDSAYEKAKRPIRELQLLRGARPFTRDELNLLISTVRNQSADIGLRIRALTALWHAKEPNQRGEAIQVSVELLRDPSATVRAYAIRALGELGALRKYQGDVEKMARSDPDQLVRKVAEEQLKRAGL